MDNEYFGVATTPMDNYLAHYGVRGMKWGVRKAIASGDKARLGRQYAKAQKKLAKLEKQAANSKKYARRAAAMGVGAAAAGAVAGFGPGKVVKKAADVAGGAVIGAGKAASAAGRVLRKTGNKHLVNVANGLSKAGYGMQSAGINARYKTKIAGVNVDNWGSKKGISDAARNVAKSKISNTKISGAVDKHLKDVSNNTIARIGAGAVGAGLAAGAARNAYKAATAQKRAAQFRSEMNKAFAGTQYANGGSRSSSKKRRRR